MSKYLNLFIKNIQHYAPNKSNYELAKLTGVSASALGLYFSKKRSPSLETIVSIAEGLNIEPYQLIKDDKEKAIPADIIHLLENQSDTVYDTIRTILNALNQQQKKKVR